MCFHDLWRGAADANLATAPLQGYIVHVNDFLRFGMQSFLLRRPGIFARLRREQEAAHGTPAPLRAATSTQ